MTRREWLSGAFGSLVTAAGSQSIPQPQRLQRIGTPKRVVILGAGLSGLTAAYELREAGHDVTVLEARMRAGGRVLTIRDPFADGLYAEAGATRIPENNLWTLHYVNQFGLALEPFRRGGDDVTYAAGRRIHSERNSLADLRLPLRPDERDSGLAGLRGKYTKRIAETLADLTTSNWFEGSYQRYSTISWAELLAEYGASTGAIKLLTLGTIPGGDHGRRVSALHTLRAQSWRRKTQNYYRIRGGTDLLPREFAGRLQDRILYGASVTRIEHDTEKVMVRFDRTSREAIRADYVVCSIPATILRTIHVQPPLPDAKRRAIRDVTYDSVTKVFLQTRTRFWSGEGLSGFAATDLPISEFWDLSQPNHGQRGMMVAYATGGAAEHVQKMDGTERIRFAATQAGAIFLRMSDQLEGGMSYSWDQDEWARGAYAYLARGQSPSIVAEIGRPEGRIHFAGEHTSAWPGWMQGALESGYRAATEINSRADVHP